MILQELVNSFKGKKVAFIGVGISHMALIERFAKLGAQVQALDKNELTLELDTQLKDLGVQVISGANYAQDLDADIYFRTPGLPFNSELVSELRRRKKIVTSEMELFFETCPCKIIGVTGSDGKTTTTTLVYEMLKQAGVRAHIGGNIGLPLLVHVDEMKENDVAVVELSSFQLESMRKSPNIAVITNITPNHLNVHKTMESYVEAKEHIVRHQDAFSKTVLNLEDEYFEYFFNLTRGRVTCFGKTEKAEICLQNDGIYSRGDLVISKAEIKLKGEHNIKNYLAAIAAVEDYVASADIREVAKKFSGVEHRIEFCGELNGVRFFNDSIATTPFRTITGLAVFAEPIILIAGGSDKGLLFDELGKEIVKKVKHLVLIGETAGTLKSVVEHSDGFNPDKLKIEETDILEDAVEMAMRASARGDVVILSPACASFGLFRNFEERGQRFKEAVLKIIRNKRRMP